MSDSYLERRGEIETYFDRTAAAAWQRLTSDAPVSGIRATVRAGRDRMRSHAARPSCRMTCADAAMLDAGCGTGALAVEAAKRGADVTAVDISPTLIGIARRAACRRSWAHGRIHFMAGDMLDKKLGSFDHVVAMDSLIHYSLPDMIGMLPQLSDMSRSGIALHLCAAYAGPRRHAFGRQGLSAQRPFARASCRMQPPSLYKRISAFRAPAPTGGLGRNARVSSGFYISHAQELKRA